MPIEYGVDILSDTTGKEIAEAIRNTDKVDKLKTDLTTITGCERIEGWIEGSYITTNGTTVDLSSPVTNSRWRHVVIDCSEGDIFTISGIGGSSSRLWCFINVDGTVLKVAGSNATADKVVITAPAYSVKLIINDNNTDSISYKGEFVENIKNNINEQIDELKGDIADMEVTETVTSNDTNFEAKIGDAIITNFEKSESDFDVICAGKNVFEISAESSGIFTVDKTAGTVTVDAVTTSVNTIILGTFIGDGSTYIISGVPSGAKDNTYFLTLRNAPNFAGASHVGSVYSNIPYTLNSIRGTVYYIGIYVRGGITLNGIFKPMIRKIGTDDTFEPFKSYSRVTITPETVAPVSGLRAISGINHCWTSNGAKVSIKYPIFHEMINNKISNTVHNVRNYGAVGDGISNDRDSIQRALDACHNNGGGNVIFPQGTYLLEKNGIAFESAYLYVHSNTKLIFDKGAIIKRGDNYTAHIIRTYNASEDGLYSGAENIEIYGAIIDANGDGTNWATSICTTHAKNVYIRDCHFKNGAGPGHYIEVNSTYNCTIENCTFDEPIDMGIYMQIEWASGHGNGGISDNTPCENVFIKNCIFNTGANDKNGMCICNEDSDDTSKYIRVSDCIFEGRGGVNGYINFLKNISNVDVYNCTFKSGAKGIGFNNSCCTAHDNRFDSIITAISGGIAYNNVVDGVLVN